MTGVVSFFNHLLLLQFVSHATRSVSMEGKESCSFTSTTLAWLGHCPPFLSSTRKWLELSSFSLTIYSWASLPAMCSQVSMTYKRSYPPYIMHNYSYVGVAPFTSWTLTRLGLFRFSLVFYYYPSLSATCSHVSRMCKGSCPITSRMLTWFRSCPLFTLCALKCLEWHFRWWVAYSWAAQPISSTGFARSHIAAGSAILWTSHWSAKFIY